MGDQDQEWKEINPGIWKPEKDGDSISGILVSKEEADKANNISAKYRVENVDGVFLVWGCTVLDDRMITVKVGDKVRITFVEKKDIGKGKHLNIYKVEVANPIEATA